MFRKLLAEQPIYSIHIANNIESADSDISYDDDIDAADDEVSESPPQVLNMEYRDSRGNKSQRQVAVKKLKHQEKGATLTCYCFMRRQVRSFKVSNIIALFDVDGVEIEDVAEFLETWFGSSSSPEKGDKPAVIQTGSAGNRLTGLCHEIVVLKLLAYADGHLADEEIEFVSEYIEQRAADLKIPLDSRQGIASLVMRTTTDEFSVERAFNYLASLPGDEKDGFAKACRQLVRVDGVFVNEEVELLNAISAELAF